jgi:hypothetical protein
MTDRPKTAADLIGELEADPAYIGKQEQRDREFSRREALQREAEAPLVKDLRSAGFDVDSAWDLVNTSKPYPEALPILVQHLNRPYPSRIREGIARALAVPDAAFARESLIRLYRNERADSDAKVGIAVAIAAAADDDFVVELIELVRDKSNGESRVILLGPVAKSSSPQAKRALTEFERDPSLSSKAR